MKNVIPSGQGLNNRASLHCGHLMNVYLFRRQDVDEEDHELVDAAAKSDDEEEEYVPEGRRRRQEVMYGLFLAGNSL